MKVTICVSICFVSFTFPVDTIPDTIVGVLPIYVIRFLYDDTSVLVTINCTSIAKSFFKYLSVDIMIHLRDSGFVKDCCNSNK